MDWILWRIKCSKSTVFSKYTTMKTKENALKLKFHPFSAITLSEQQEKEEQWEEVDTHTDSTWYWLRDVNYHSLETCKNQPCLIEHQISRRVWLKAFLRNPINSLSLNSFSNIADLNRILMYKCTTVSISRPFLRLLMSARSGATCYHTTLPNKIGSDLPSQYIDGLMLSVFAEILAISQIMESGTQIHTIHYYIAEVYPALIHCMECTLS